MSDVPIVVNANPAKDQVATGIRYVLMAAAAVASSLGFSGVAGKFTALLVTAGPVATAAVFLWGQWSARHRSKQAAAMASLLPDKIAQVKS